VFADQQQTCLLTRYHNTYEPCLAECAQSAQTLTVPLKSQQRVEYAGLHGNTASNGPVTDARIQPFSTEQQQEQA